MLIVRQFEFEPTEETAANGQIILNGLKSFWQVKRSGSVAARLVEGSDQKLQNIIDRNCLTATNYTEEALEDDEYRSIAMAYMGRHFNEDAEKHFLSEEFIASSMLIEVTRQFSGRPALVRTLGSRSLHDVYQFHTPIPSKFKSQMVRSEAYGFVGAYSGLRESSTFPLFAASWRGKPKRDVLRIIPLDQQTGEPVIQLDIL